MDPHAGQDELELIKKTIGNPLEPGELGALIARAGVGKTACLTHIALEHLLDGKPALHVCIDGGAEKIKIWYHELLKRITLSLSREEFAVLQRRIEPIRSILAYLHHTFSIQKLEQSLCNLKDQAGFNPSVVILDGLDLESSPRETVSAISDFAKRYGVSVWMSVRTHQHITVANERGIPYPCHECDDLFRTIIQLKSGQKAIHVLVLKDGNHYPQSHPEILLDPQSYLLLKS